jgi:hypothetical protein
MKNRRSVKVLLDHCEEQREILPRISKLDTDNYAELDEQIMLLDYFLNTGKVPNMDDYREDTTDKFALWLLELNTEYDDLVEGLLEDGRD